MRAPRNRPHRIRHNKALNASALRPSLIAPTRSAHLRYAPRAHGLSSCAHFATLEGNGACACAGLLPFPALRAT